MKNSIAIWVFSDRYSWKIYRNFSRIPLPSGFFLRKKFLKKKSSAIFEEFHCHPFFPTEILRNLLKSQLFLSAKLAGFSFGETWHNCWRIPLPSGFFPTEILKRKISTAILQEFHCHLFVPIQILYEIWEISNFPFGKSSWLRETW